MVFTKTTEHGAGPSLSLYISEVEIIKYDFFGAGKGHYHVQPHFDERLPLYPETIELQILDAIKDIKYNTISYLSEQSQHEINGFVFDDSKFFATLENAKDILLGLSNKY